MIKKLINILFFELLLFCLLPAHLKSENKIFLRDTTIQRGLNVTIPIYGTIDFSPLDNITLEFQYDARIINISSVEGDPNFIIISKKPNFQNQLRDLNNALLIVSSNEAQPKDQGILCYLELEGLVFSDSIVDITLNRIVINGIERNELAGKIGRIIVRGQSFLPNFPDNLGLNYPNPFASQTRFEFNLENTTQISFFMYNSTGQEIYSSINTPEIFEVYSYDGNLINEPFTKLLTRGKYYVLFSPPTYDFASGMYFFGMKTDKGFYNRSFLVIK